jgi:hypothetical protein
VAEWIGCEADQPVQPGYVWQTRENRPAKQNQHGDECRDGRQSGYAGDEGAPKATIRLGSLGPRTVVSRVWAPFAALPELRRRRVQLFSRIGVNLAEGAGTRDIAADGAYGWTFGRRRARCCIGGDGHCRLGDRRLPDRLRLANRLER